MSYLIVLRYSCLAAIIVLASVIQIVKSFSLKSQRDRGANRIWRNSLVGGVIITYAVEALIPIFRKDATNQDDNIYNLSQIMWWSLILVADSPWDLCIAASLVVVIFETVIAVLSWSSWEVLTIVMLTCYIARAVVLSGLAIVSARIGFHQNGSTDDEREPLLNGNTSDIMDDSDSDEEQEGNWVKKKQRERLDSSGNWWKYLAAFRIFIPFVIPQKNRRLQLCFAGLVGILLINRILTLLVPRQLGLVTDKLVGGSHEIPYRELLIWLALSWIHSSAGLGYVQTLLSTQIDLFSYRQIVQAAFDHVISLSIDFHNDADSAELIAALSQGSGLGSIIDILAFSIVPDIIDLGVAFTYFTVLFGFYVSFTVFLGGILYSSISVRMANWTRLPSVEATSRKRIESRTIHQAVEGWQTVSTFNRAKFESQRVGTAIRELQQWQWQRTWKRNLTYAAEALVTTVAFFSVMLIAAVKIAKDEIPIGSFVILLSYWDSLINPLMAFSWYYGHIQQELISAERLLLLLQTKPSVVDKEGATTLTVKSGAVTFNRVHFSYDPRKETLTDISMIVKPGQTIALVGETGGGKSTLLKLLYRFFDVSKGTISIDGQDISTVKLGSLREALGIVDQHPFLFNISILENLRYGRLDATDDEIHEACKAAVIHDKILTFPDGYNSTVGARGLKLSGGELQRVAIARVLLKNPKIVLLDEATSAVDTDTEVLIQTALKRLTMGRTTFVVAHRLSTIVSADQVLVVQDGRIIQRGTHEELARVEGKYRSLWSKQVAATVGDGEVDSGLTRRIVKDIDGVVDA